MPSLAIVFSVVLGMALWSEQTARAPLEARLAAPVKDHTLVARDLPSALAKVAGEFQIPMVIEWIDRPGRNAVQASLKAGSAYDLIRSVAEGQPGYGIETANGVVHVFNRRFLGSRQNFLNLEVKSFQRETTPAFLLGGDLLQLAAETVSPPPPPPPLPPGPYGIGRSQALSLDEPTVTLNLHNVTFREALEALARESDNEIWVVTFLGSSEVTPTGFRRTITLWNDSPESDKPAWDFFRWGQGPRRLLDQAPSHE